MLEGGQTTVFLAKGLQVVADGIYRFSGSLADPEVCFGRGYFSSAAAKLTPELSYPLADFPSFPAGICFLQFNAI